MDNIELLVSIYRQKGLLIDTNLLLLYSVGKTDPTRIERFKRTVKFTVDEFLILERFLRLFIRVITTPNVLTEVSNLLGQLPQNLYSSFYGGLVSQIAELDERYTPSRSLAESTHFTRFGLTDSGIAALAPGKYLVLTDDLNLFGYLQNKGIDAINFNHLRLRAWTR